MHGLPFGVTREEQQKVDEQAGKIAIEGASFLIPELRGLKAAEVFGKGALDLSKLSTAELKAIIKENGGVDLLNAKGLFGSGVNGAKEALKATEIPKGVTEMALRAYRKIATRNIQQEVQQIRVQVVDKMLDLLKGK